MTLVWSPEAIGDLAALRSPRASHFISSASLKHYFRTIPKWGDLVEFREHANS